MASLSVVVFGLGGMKHLPQCLDSVQWADEVTVWDLDSKRDVDPVQEWERLAREIKTDWVLHLWGEEKVGGELREELKVICQEPLQTAPRFHLIPVRSLILGRWVKGSLWSPMPSCRLWRQNVSPPDSWWSLDRGLGGGSSKTLIHGIEDYSCAELKEGVERINQISSLVAERLNSQGRTLGSASIFLYPIRVLFELLLINGLLFDGLPGMSLSGLAAYSTLVSGMKWWESHHAATGP